MGWPRRRRCEPTAMGEALEAALRRSGLTEQARRIRIVRAWRTAVGDHLAERAAPESLRRGVLVVRSVSPAWQNELVYLRQKIIDSINGVLGECWVKELRLVSGARPRTRSRSTDSTKRLSGDELEEIRRAAELIVDTELRDVVEGTLRQVALRGGG